MYTTARNIFGWSDNEFWNATPRMYFAVLYKYAQIKNAIEAEPKQEVLIGREAICALSSLASKIK